jgi:hypothetical protein
MTRIAIVSLFALLSLGDATNVLAQNPPTERELRIYAGLHDAAARGDVAEIEKLIADGEKPISTTATAARRCMSRSSATTTRRRARFCASAPTRTRSTPNATTSSRSRQWTTTSKC